MAHKLVKVRLNREAALDFLAEGLRLNTLAMPIPAQSDERLDEGIKDSRRRARRGDQVWCSAALDQQHRSVSNGEARLALNSVS